MLRTATFSAVAALSLAACGDIMPVNADAEACAQAVTPKEKYLDDVGGLFWSGPCVGRIITADVNDLLQPVRGDVTFQDLLTGQVVRLTFVGDEILALERP